MERFPQEDGKMNTYHHSLLDSCESDYDKVLTLREEALAAWQRIRDSVAPKHLHSLSASLAVLVVPLLIAAIALGYLAHALTEFDRGITPAQTMARAYPLPTNKAQLPRCIAELRARYPGTYEYVRYREYQGSRLFIFHSVDRMGEKDIWIACDADSGILIQQ